MKKTSKLLKKDKENNKIFVSKIIAKLKKHSSKKNVEGMARFGISSINTLGVPMPTIRTLAKDIGRNQKLSRLLWDTKIHEARILAALTGEHELVTKSQMNLWARDFDSWDVCDQVCMNLFDKTEFAYDKAIEFSRRKKEFVRRAGFALMASLAVHDKKEDDSRFITFFECIKEGATDERNYVKKAVNWALRQIGKRSLKLNKLAITCAKKILTIDTPPARFIARDAIRELKSEKIRARIKR